MVTAMKCERLAEAVEGRRRELRLSPTEFAAVTGITAQGLLPLRHGMVKRYQERLTGPVCRVFGWSPDSIERILDGGEPIIVGGGYVPPEPDEVKALERRLTDQILNLNEQVAQLKRRLNEV